MPTSMISTPGGSPAAARRRVTSTPKPSSPRNTLPRPATRTRGALTTRSRRAPRGARPGEVDLHERDRGIGARALDLHALDLGRLRGHELLQGGDDDGGRRARLRVPGAAEAQPRDAVR